MDRWPYLYNQWYATCWASDLGTDLLERSLLDESIVIYRTRAGNPVGLSNRCAHHHFPLSKGRIIDDRVECGYHGFTFDCTGVCTRIPGQVRIPEKVRVRSYPVVERWKWIWVWMGDPSLADESKIPNFYWLDHPDWEAVGDSLELNARHKFLNENLLDLTHVEFVHRGSIGAQDLSEFPIETSVRDGKVFVSRTMNSIEAPPLFVKTMGLSNRIDRWQVEEFQPPCYHIVHVTAGEVGSSPDESCQYKVLNAVVPEKNNRTKYLWAVCRNYRRDEKWISDYLREAVQSVFMEDVMICEEQERVLATLNSSQEEMLVRMDAGITRARRILLKMKEEEAVTRAVIPISESTHA